MGPTVRGADGVALHVEINGSPGAPVTVVLAHGWTLDSRSWGPVARSLVAATPARVVRFDHRGHGRSAAVDPATMTIEQLADDMAAVLTAVAPEGPLVLGGHSMGGMAVMALAQRHPQLMRRVAGVAFVATASGDLTGHPRGLPARAVALLRWGEPRLHASRRWAGRRALGNPKVLAPALRWLLLGPRPGPEAARITVESVAACRPLTVSGFRAALESHERDTALAAFAGIPTVVLAGTKDRLTPVRLSRRIVAALPSAALSIYPGAGHMLPVERVAGVTARIGALVESAEAAAGTGAA
jgi:pimeloyl-ACP methyl ester carboxylesterase